MGTKSDLEEKWFKSMEVMSLAYDVSGYIYSMLNISSSVKMDLILDERGCRS